MLTSRAHLIELVDRLTLRIIEHRIRKNQPLADELVLEVRALQAKLVLRHHHP